MKLFGKYIQSSHLPSSKDILAAIKEHKCLQRRTVPQIRTWLHNQRKVKIKYNSPKSTSLSCEDSNDETDSQPLLVLKSINSIFKKHIKTKHIPVEEECTSARIQSKFLSNLSTKQIQTAVFKLISN